MSDYKIEVGQIYIFNGLHDFSIYKVIKINKPTDFYQFEITLQELLFNDTKIRYVAKLTTKLDMGDLLTKNIVLKQQIIRKTFEVS